MTGLVASSLVSNHQYQVRHDQFRFGICALYITLRNRAPRRQWAFDFDEVRRSGDSDLDPDTLGSSTRELQASGNWLIIVCHRELQTNIALCTSGIIHLFPAKYRQSARISVTVRRFRQYGIEHLLLGTAHEFRYSAAQSA